MGRREQRKEKREGAERERERGLICCNFRDK